VPQTDGQTDKETEIDKVEKILMQIDGQTEKETETVKVEKIQMQIDGQTDKVEKIQRQTRPMDKQIKNRNRQSGKDTEADKEEKVQKQTKKQKQSGKDATAETNRKMEVSRTIKDHFILPQIWNFCEFRVLPNLRHHFNFQRKNPKVPTAIHCHLIVFSNYGHANVFCTINIREYIFEHFSDTYSDTFHTIFGNCPGCLAAWYI
jgi:hypothetical protein